MGYQAGSPTRTASLRSHSGSVSRKGVHQTGGWDRHTLRDLPGRHYGWFSSPLHMTRSTRTVSELTGFRLTRGFRGWDMGDLLWPKLSPCCEDCIQGATIKILYGRFYGDHRL